MDSLRRVFLVFFVLASLTSSRPAEAIPEYPVGAPASVRASTPLSAEASRPPLRPPVAPASAPVSAVAAFQNSLSLDGVNDHVSVPDNASLTPASALTIEAWVRRTSVGCQTIVGKNFNVSYWLGFCNDAIRFYSGGSLTSQDGVTSVPANVWTHIAVVWQSGVGRWYYINGDLDYSSATAGAASPDNAHSLYIGYDPSLCCPFAGNIAEVRIWSVARSQDDIRRTMHIALEEPRPGLVANWHLSDDYKDNIGGNDGTAQNGASLAGPPAPPRPAVSPVDSYFGNLPSTRYHAASAYIPQLNRAVLIGGLVGGASSGAVDRVDVGSGALTNIGALGVTRVYASAAYVPTNDKVYVFGGSSSTLSSNSQRTIFAVDPNDGAVTPLAATLPVSTSFGVAVYHPGLNQIYVMGGVNNAGVVLSGTLAFDPATETVTPLTLTIPGDRYLFAAAYSSLTDKIYVFGGLNGSFTPISTTYEITLQTDGLSGAIAALPSSAALPRPSSDLVAVEDPTTHLIYLVGGNNNDRVIVFDPATTQTWETLIQASDRRTDHAVVFDSLNRRAIVMGGYAGVAKRDIWRIPLGDGPAIGVGRWDFPQAAGSYVTAIHGDEKKVVVGTFSSGLYVYDSGGSRTHWTPGLLGSANGYVSDVRYNAPNDHVWAATNDAGGKLITNTATTYDSSVLGTNQILAVDTYPGYVDFNGAPFFGAAAGQGLRWRDFSLFALPGGYYWRTDFPGQSINALAHRAVGDVWGISSGQLVRMVYTPGLFGSTVTTSTFTSVASCDLLTPPDLAFDRSGDLWVVSPNTILLAAQGPNVPALSGQGICQIIRPTSTMASQLRTPSIGAAATSVDVDSDGRIWVALHSQFGESGGLVTYQNLSGTLRVAETNWLTAPVGSNSNFTAVGAADERVWTGRSDGRLITVAPRWQQFDEVANLSQYQVYGMWTARGRLFLAAGSGAFQYLFSLAPDGKTWDQRNVTGATVNAVMGDSRGHIWVGSDAGVRRYLPAGWDMLTDTVGTPPVSAVHALAEDQNGRVWMGGLSGLTLFDRDRFVATFSAANSNLPNSPVRALLVDRNNHVWIGTDTGLARLRDNTFEVFSTTHGLPSNGIHDLAQAGDGRVAVSTNSGLAFFDGVSSFYTETLPVSAVNLPLTVDDQGRLWAGGAARNSGGWQAYYLTNSGLRSSTIRDNAADGAGYIWFGHFPAYGVSVRGTYLPPLGTVLPTIFGSTPLTGSAGTVITITGSGFSANPPDVNVTVGGAPVELLRASETQLVVRANENTTSGDVSVNSRGQRVTYVGSGGNRAFCAVPIVHTFNPTGGNNGVPITIRGTNFDTSGVRVYLGGGTEHLPFSRTPTELRVFVQPGDGSGVVQVSNSVAGCPTFTAASATTFNAISLNVATLALNQGIPSYGLMAHRPTLISSFLSRGVALRPTDQLQIDAVDVTFINPTGTSVTRTIPYTGAVPSSLGAPSAALLRDIGNSVNVNNIAPGVPGFADGSLTTRVTLRRLGQVVAQTSRTDAYERNRVMRVMLVPIMQAGYTSADYWGMRSRVEAGLGDLRRRIMPTGQVEFIWSPTTLTHGPVALDDILALYDTSHSMDRIRRQWNENSSQDTLIAFGVVDGRIITGNATGYGFWPDLSELINVLLAGWVDTLCDVGNAVLQVLSFGLLGSDDGCHLEIPLYVGWASGGDTQSSFLFGHEFGHIMGLVKPWAPNGDALDNFSHSVNDELNGGECGGGSVTYNVNKTLYRQPGVSEPVVNPITGQQFRAQLLTQDDGMPAKQNTLRGKAIMSYACNQLSVNDFYEPVDIGSVLAMFGASSFLNFFHDLRPGAGLLAQSENAPQATNDVPTPRPMPGPRLYVSGMVNRVANTGELRRVEALGDDAPLSASFATGYWLVQLGSGSQELSRIGVFPMFTLENPHGASRTPGDRLNSPQVESDVGFFAATILRAGGVVTLELRHDNTALATFRAGSAAPTVSLSSPTGGVYSGGDLPVAWSASDADSDPLNIAVEYSADDGANWSPVAFISGTTSTVNVPVYQLAGSINARVRVIASDGFNLGVVTSTVFSVAYQPPRPFINQPVSNTVYVEGQQIAFAGGAGDNQDRLVASANLRWRSSRDGELGAGSELGAVLSVGDHTITLEAMNSAGLTATAAVTLTVQGDYDFDGMTDTEELSDQLNPLTESDAFGDADGDGLPLIMERRRNTNPNSVDSDGDGRSDASEIAAGTDPTVNDAPLPPDQLAIYPGTLVFTANLALDTLLPQQQVQVVSRAPAAWTLSANVPWLGATAISGTTPAGPTILAQAYLVDEGTHTGVLTFTSTALGSVVTAPVTLTVINKRAYCDVNRDGQTNIADIQGVAARVGTDNSQPGFDYHYDIDRDGDVDANDAQLVNLCVFNRRVYLPVVRR